jgi:hypothetical protein
MQSTTRVKPFICTMPMRLDEGWNQIQFNLADFTRRAYGKRGKRGLSCSKHGRDSAVPAPDGCHISAHETLCNRCRGRVWLASVC